MYCVVVHVVLTGGACYAATIVTVSDYHMYRITRVNFKFTGTWPINTHARGRPGPRSNILRNTHLPVVERARQGEERGRTIQGEGASVVSTELAYREVCNGIVQCLCALAQLLRDVS